MVPELIAHVMDALMEARSEMAKEGRSARGRHLSILVTNLETALLRAKAADNANLVEE